MFISKSYFTQVIFLCKLPETSMAQFFLSKYTFYSSLDFSSCYLSFSTDLSRSNLYFLSLSYFLRIESNAPQVFQAAISGMTSSYPRSDAFLFIRVTSPYLSHVLFTSLLLLCWFEVPQRWDSDQTKNFFFSCINYLLFSKDCRKVQSYNNIKNRCN